MCLVFGSCATLDREVGNGIQETKLIELTSFEKISYDISHGLIIRHGDVHEVNVIGDSNILDHVVVEIREGVLYIDLASGSYVNISLKIEVTMASLTSVENTSSGNIFVEAGTVVEDNLSLITDGSGDIRVESQHDISELNIKIDGSGDISFDGETTASVTNIITDSSGDINAYSLSSNNCNIYADGSGDIRLTVMEELVGIIEGSGDVYYKGSPQIDMDYKGSGKLINKN